MYYNIIFVVLSQYHNWLFHNQETNIHIFQLSILTWFIHSVNSVILNISRKCYLNVYFIFNLFLTKIAVKMNKCKFITFEVVYKINIP